LKVCRDEFRDAENFMFIETDPTLPLIGTDLFLQYSEWQDILFEKSLSEKQDLKNVPHRAKTYR